MYVLLVEQDQNLTIFYFLFFDCWDHILFPGLIQFNRSWKSTRMTAAVKAVSSPDQLEFDLSLSPRVNSVKPSKTVAITDQATALLQAGIPVIRLAAGEPDFDTPAAIAEVLFRSSMLLPIYPSSVFY